MNDTPVTHWRAGKARELLSYLLIKHGQPVPRSVLIEMLWPHNDASGTSLKVAAHAIRKILAATQAGAPTAGRGSSLELLSHDSGYMLHVENVWIDVDEVETALETARGLERRGELDESLVFYRRAVGLYRGAFLAGDSAIWVEQHREWIKDLALEAMRRVCNAAIEAGDYSGAIVLSRRILEIEPWLEEAYRSLMLCHARLEQRGRVKSWYELCVRRLREELELDPEYATQLLFQQAMQGRLLAPTDSRRPTYAGRRDAAPRSAQDGPAIAAYPMASLAARQPMASRSPLTDGSASGCSRGSRSCDERRDGYGHPPTLATG